MLPTFASPPSESLSRKVSLELRYGTWDKPFLWAAMTSPSADSDLHTVGTHPWVDAAHGRVHTFPLLLRTGKGMSGEG